ncbi:uncharacterized protein [Anabrus simplex]|uniref:uncharacterized protein n=1 Tax=Anabrus simplex TaxID=316456 RepID=UPI0035A321D7
MFDRCSDKYISPSRAHFWRLYNTPASIPQSTTTTMKTITIFCLLSAVCAVALGQGLFFNPFAPQQQQQGQGDWLQQLFNPFGIGQQQQPLPWSFLFPQNNRNQQQQGGQQQQQPPQQQQQQQYDQQQEQQQEQQPSDDNNGNYQNETPAQ